MDSFCLTRRKAGSLIYHSIITLSWSSHSPSKLLCYHEPILEIFPSCSLQPVLSCFLFHLQNKPSVLCVAGVTRQLLTFWCGCSIFSWPAVCLIGCICLVCYVWYISFCVTNPLLAWLELPKSTFDLQFCSLLILIVLVNSTRTVIQFVVLVRRTSLF